MTEAPPAAAPRRPGRRAASRAARRRREAAQREPSATSGAGGDARASGLRLNKLLATRGIGARRKCDALIRAGSVRVNGTVVKEPGLRVEPDRDRIEVHGRPVPGRSALRYLMVHKPVGVISTLDDPEGRPTVRTLLPSGPRLFPVGRLDAETSGLLIATNDGELAHHLMHPRYGVPKLYRVRLDRPPDAEQIRLLRSGVEFEPRVVSAPCEVRVRNARPDRAEIEITLHEGRYRQVRRMCEAVGLAVRGLHRPAYGPLRLAHLPRGAWRDLTPEELGKLKAASARPGGTGPRRARPGLRPLSPSPASRPVASRPAASRPVASQPPPADVPGRSRRWRPGQSAASAGPASPRGPKSRRASRRPGRPGVRGGGRKRVGRRSTTY